MGNKIYVGKNSSYTPVAYIESSGTQYINTLFNPNQNTKVEMGIAGTGTNGYWFGTWNIGYNNGAFAVCNDNTNVYSGYGNQGGGSGSVVSDDTHVITLDKNIVYIDGTSFRTFSTATFQVYYPLFLFAQNRYGTAYRPPTNNGIKLQYCKIYDNGTLVKDFIPVTDENNIACLFEKNSNQFYYNQGSGTFTAGNTTGETTLLQNNSRKIVSEDLGKTATFTPVEYVESTGTQYIDTGVKANNNTKVVMEISDFPPNSAWGAAFGARSSADSTDEYVFYRTDTGLYRSDYGDNRVTFASGTSLENKTTVTKDGANTTINGTTITNTASTFSANYTMWLFALNQADTINHPTSFKLYSFKIYENGTELTRDFIPAKDENGTYLLFDKVEERPYYSKVDSFNGGNPTGDNDIVCDNARKIKNIYVGVPETFTPVEYIQSTGTQFIDTGLSAFSLITTGKIEEKVQYTDSTTRQQYGYLYYSSLNGTNNVFFAPIGILNGKWHTQFGGDNSYELTTADTSLHTFITDMKNKKAYIDGTSYTISTNNTGTTDGNVFLFCRNTNGAYFNYKKVYYTKIYNNDVLIRDFIPVVDSNNVACLYDKVEGKAYYNQGTGIFYAGSTTGEDAITGSYAKKIATTEKISYFYSNIAPTTWSGTATSADAIFLSTNSYGTWIVNGSHNASSSSYVAWKAVDSDNNSYYNASGNYTFTLTLPKNIYIQPRYVTIKYGYFGAVKVTGITEDNVEKELFSTTLSKTSSSQSIANAISTKDYFSKFKVIVSDRNTSYGQRLYAFRFESGKVKDTRTS